MDYNAAMPKHIPVEWYEPVDYRVCDAAIPIGFTD